MADLLSCPLGRLVGQLIGQLLGRLIGVFIGQPTHKISTIFPDRERIHIWHNGRVF